MQGNGPRVSGVLSAWGGWAPPWTAGKPEQEIKGPMNSLNKHTSSPQHMNRIIK